jgi:4-carboxymuconolactone decarboxylase
MTAPRIPFADPATLAPDVRALYDAASLGIMRVLANATDSVLPWVGVVQAIRNSPDLDPQLRELVILRMLTTVDAPHEWAGHEAAARAAGATTEQIEAIRSGTPFGGPAGVLTALIGELFAGRPLADARVAETLEVVSPRALVEAVQIAGVYLTIGRLIELIGPGAGPLDAAA